MKCGKCKMCLYPEDLVMRTNSSIYHYACFSCSVCGISLRHGDEYMASAPSPNPHQQQQQQHQQQHQNQQHHIVCKDHFNTTATAPPGVLLSVVEMTEIVADGAQGRGDQGRGLGEMQQQQQQQHILQAVVHANCIQSMFPRHFHRAYYSKNVPIPTY